METVILQHLDLTDGSLGLKKASSTYLNCIPLSKYREYCGIDKITIRLESSVQTTVSLRYLFLDGHVVTEEHKVEGPTEIIADSGDVITLTSPHSDSVKGIVEASVEKRRDIILEHVTCTFHREAAVYEKIRMFSDAGLQNYHMIVVDNGSTVKVEENTVISLIKMPNMGGSSGFTRGIVAGLDRGCTHILLNDDDAYIHPESVFRMIQFLSIISPIYTDYSITGVFLDIYNPNMVREAGCLFDKGLINSCCCDENISTEKGILSITSPRNMDYSAWTCCCIPTDVIRRIELPLPMFVKFDDIEYSLRLDRKLISVPGITVWHPTYFEYPLGHRYYDMRNRLVAVACSDGLDHKSINNAFDHVLTEIASYRYDCAEEMIDGVYDFMKGPDNVFRSCIDGIHRSRTVDFQDLDTLRKCLRPKTRDVERSKRNRMLTMNGLFLPSIGDIELSRSKTETKVFYRIGKVLYSADKKKGVLRKRSRYQAIRLTIKTLWAKKKIQLNAKKLNSMYKSSFEKYTSLEQWERLWDEARNIDSSNKLQ